MIVYIDYIFIENFIMDYLLLYQTTKFIKEKHKKIRLCLASLIGAIYVTIMIAMHINEMGYIIFKLILSFVLVYIAFKPNSLKKYIKEIIVFYFITIINTGTYLVMIMMFNITLTNNILKIIIYLIGSGFVWIINNEMWKVFKLRLKKEALVYEVYIKNKKKYIKYKGFVDTGNTSKHIETGRMIFYATQKENIDISEYIKVEVISKTVQGTVLLEGYKINDVIIKGKNITKTTDIVVCFLEQEINNKLNCDMIMNYGIYEELLGGIYI